ncbi:MAG: hypothetical protein H7Z42_19890 [Roseiflexaceae bacterium]|nr:hypothetical protein [Roseiflexaceae bacterium]
MSKLMQLYTDETAALHAADGLVAAGVPAADLHVLVMRPTEQEGRVGTFDNEDERGQRVGSFDGEDASLQPEARFDDTSGRRTDLHSAPQGRFDDGQSVRPRISYAAPASILHEVMNAGIDQAAAERAIGTAQSGAVLLADCATVDEARLRELMG